MEATLASVPLPAPPISEGSCCSICPAALAPGLQGNRLSWPAQQAPPQGGWPFLPWLPPSSLDPRSASGSTSSSSPASCPGRDGPKCLGTWWWLDTPSHCPGFSTWLCQEGRAAAVPQRSDWQHSTWVRKQQEEAEGQLSPLR